MKKRSLLSLLVLVILSLVVFGFVVIFRVRGNSTKELTADFYGRQTMVFYEKSRKHELRFDTFNPQPFVGKTKVLVDAEASPQLELNGFFYKAYSLDVEGDNQTEIVIEVETGQSLNSLIYKYINGVLTRIPVSTEISSSWQGIVSRNEPEFKDLTGDGVLEMLVYYRFFPPEKRRQVEVYKFDGLKFLKVKEYLEPTDEVYL